MIAAEHFGDKNVIVTVPVDIREVNRHGGIAGLAQRRRRERPEDAFALVDPKPVRREIIIADIEIRQSVAVHIAKHCAQAPVTRRAGQRSSIFIQETATGPGDRLEVATTVVEVKNIRLAEFQ